MGFRKKAVTSAVLLAMLIASSAPVPIAEHDSTATTNSLESREEKMSRYRLPNNTIPRLYNIHVEPNMDDEQFTWTGITSIDVEIVDPTALLTLHAYKNLVINESFTELVGPDRTKLRPVKHDRDNEVEFLKLQFDREIPVGNYSLNLKFKGTSTGEPDGFYRASRGEIENMTVAGCHFQPTSARRALPCWDEPGFKAHFRVSVKHFPNYTALANMPENDHVDTADGKILTTFDTTPVMSTYLLNFVIGNYQNVFNEHRNVSLHASRSALDEVRHLLDLSPKVVEVMESYTGLPFGLPRIGSVMMPTFTSVATEHWGLVSYRFDGNSAGSLHKHRAYFAIAHELSHSWFGNRVTPLWWDDLWLNEGFATYFEYYIIDELYDNWNSAELFVVHNNQQAFTQDTHDKVPVRWTPITNTEILQVFGWNTYRKGAAIIHMFHNVLGDNVFRSGIQKFMAKHSFKTAVTEDLMTAFQEAHDEGPNKEKPLNVKETMTSWLEHKGYPIVNVTRNYTTGDTEVFQRSNLLVDNSDKWWIPLTYATKSSPNFTSTLPASWFSDKEGRAQIDGIDKDDWIVLNVRASGYYRVNYDDENWNRLADYLNTDNYTNIHVLNRAQLISDAFYLAQREPDRYLRIFHKVTKYLSREVEYLPWLSAYYALIRIEYSLRYTETHELFKRHFLELMHSFVEKVGFEPQDTEHHFAKLSRTDVINWACMSGHSSCLEYSAEKLMKYAENPVENPLHPDNRVCIYCAGLRGFNDTSAKRYVNLTFEVAGYEFFTSLGCTENHEVHRMILNNWLTNFDWDPSAMFRHLLTSSETNFNTAVDFILENSRAIKNSSIAWKYPIPAIVSDIYYQAKTRARLEKFKEVMLLDVVLEDPRIHPTFQIMLTERNVAAREASAAPFLKFWTKQLSDDNSTRAGID